MTLVSSKKSRQSPVERVDQMVRNRIGQFCFHSSSRSDTSKINALNPYDYDRLSRKKIIRTMCGIINKILVDNKKKKMSFPQRFFKIKKNTVVIGVTTVTVWVEFSKCRGFIFVK